jgi:hypothetical protein
MSESDPPTQPSLPWRVASVAVMGTIGALSRGFMNGFNNLEVTGLEGLLGVLDRRKHEGRERGLLTVCNHVAVYAKLGIYSFYSDRSTANINITFTGLTILSFGESCQYGTFLTQSI